jgi:hypothetical protein
LFDISFGKPKSIPVSSNSSRSAVILKHEESFNLSYTPPGKVNIPGDDIDLLLSTKSILKLDDFGCLFNNTIEADSLIFPLVSWNFKNVLGLQFFGNFGITYPKQYSSSSCVL